MASPTLPGHVVVIMDGAAHWARYRGLALSPDTVPVDAALEAVVDAALQQGVSFLTLVPPPEAEEDAAWMLVDPLLDVLGAQRLHRQGVRIRTLGDTSGLPEETAARLVRAGELPDGGTALHLTVAVGHDGRAELLDDVRALLAAGRGSTSDALHRRLHGDDGLPLVDLVIRTGGQHRLSHVLPWHCADAELIFLDVLWPDFTTEHFRRALELYHLRRRHQEEWHPSGDLHGAGASRLDAPDLAPFEADLHDAGPMRAAVAGGREGMDGRRIVPSLTGVGGLVTLPVAVTVHLGGNLVDNLHDTARFAKARLARALLGHPQDEAAERVPMPGDLAGPVTDPGCGRTWAAASETVTSAGPGGPSGRPGP
ncbi:undecaprenyl diphosphate synthase family protein [Actinomadura chibensis]|uniref:Undecaprenyl diphosphate synthase family protein n=1 Tax=Actinomadura chibensis TaxID=392828 RepID=A0A5D0NUR3_9ACTN|nr:undecaprenyl diphosphate synthase family protein [Actinomadura chibensis]TYB47944.1 undecaprenyl diphosphate synthase family protein [Actinomadura chibensis]